MTPVQIGLVQSALPQIAAKRDDIAALFYTRLFKLDPTLRKLFAGDMLTQGRKLISAIAVVVDGLKRPDEIVPVLQSLAMRHVGYGVRESHYATVGAALLWTLERGLGAAFTAEMREAWTAAYRLASQTMIAAAYRRPANAA